MSMVERSPPGASYAPSVSSNVDDLKCLICNEIMDIDGQDCYIIVICNHIFHRACIEQALSTSDKCPYCGEFCQLSDLRKYPQVPLVSTEMATQTDMTRKTRPSARGKPRGALANRPQTRSLAKNLFKEPMHSSVNISPHHTNIALIDMAEGNPNSNQNNAYVSVSQKNPENQVPSTSNIHTTVQIDYERIGLMIESRMTQMLQNLNLRPEPSIPVPPADFATRRASLQSQNRSSHSQPLSPVPHNSRSGSNSNRELENCMSLRPEKVTSIIQNWNVKFSGSSTGLTVEEFLYRIKSLTAEHFQNNFDIICKNIPVLLTEKADKWFWRYHKQVDSIQWDAFCAALRYQFKDMRSNYELQEAVRNRKMKPGESFETFYDSVCSIADKLEHPMSEEELVGILVRNLRLEMRHELLYVPIYSVAHLRKLIQMRENLLVDEYSRRPSQGKTIGNAGNRRTVAEVHCEEEVEDLPPSACVDAVNQSAQSMKCWNCEEIGHSWQDCLKDRIIFCYGCGTKNVFKPQCVRCGHGRLSTVSKNFVRRDSPQDRP